MPTLAIRTSKLPALRRPSGPIAINAASPQARGLWRWYPLHGPVAELGNAPTARAGLPDALGWDAQALNHLMVSNPDVGWMAQTGQDDFLTATTNAGALTSGYAVSVWFRTHSQVDNRTLIGNRSGTAARVELRHRRGPVANRLSVICADFGATNTSIAEAEDANWFDGRPHLVVGTCDKLGNTQLYVDGRLRATGTAASWTHAAFTGNPTQLGADGQNANRWTGELTDARILFYDRVPGLDLDAYARALYDPLTRWELYRPLAARTYVFLEPDVAGFAGSELLITNATRA